MKKFVTALCAAGLTMLSGVAVAQDEEEKADDSSSAAPVELYACSYNDGMGRAEMDDATETFNDWADDADITDYTAWILTPFYSGPEQDFDILWLGIAPTGNALGKVQDAWIATGGDAAQGFAEVADCSTHVQFAAVQFKEPPTRDNPDNIVMAFSDCQLGDGVSFGDVAPAMSTWADLRDEQGSTAGHWALFPVSGGGGEEFDFKYIAAWQNFADMGTDFDTYSEISDQAGELFGGKLSCDSSRVYVSEKVRAADAE